jgi:hypothetical protein
MKEQRRQLMSGLSEAGKGAAHAPQTWREKAEEIRLPVRRFS